jgi:YidC/Oxa1 family membrane protein insertase
MFIQFPIWIGLYQAILQTVPSTPEKLVGLSGHLYMWLPMIEEVIPLDSSFLWLDLAVPDKYWVLPVLVGVSMWFMQKMTTMPAMDDRQASTNRMMLWMMPFMFGFFSLQFPSGLALYWVISNLAGIVIQGFITGWGPLLEILRLNKVEEDAKGTEPVTAVLDVTGSVPLASSSTLFNLKISNNGPHPVIKPWITIPAKFEMTQYSASPLGNCSEKNPNIKGIIHNIIRFVDACLSSMAGIVVIFCMNHMETPTKTGKTQYLSGTARSNQRKLLSSGITSSIIGNHIYR